jgi:hypothetical protein
MQASASELIARLWKDSPLFLTLEQFTQGLQGWELDPIQGPDGIAGVIVHRGPEFHFAKFDPAFQVDRSILKKYPGDMIARYGYAQTKTPIDDTRQQRFNQRLGFVEVARDDLDITYQIHRMRGQQCQSQQ